MKCVDVDLPESLESLQVEIFSDLHIGSRKCDYKAIQDRIEKVKNNPNCYYVMLGDIINNSITSSVASADLYESQMSPMTQIKKAIELFRPIKDKCLAITSGNHERRSYKTDGIDLLHFFAAELGLIERYDYASVLLFLSFGHRTTSSRSGPNKRKVTYAIYIAHGDGIGGKMVGGKANGLERRGQIVNSDICIIGHTHQPLSFKTSNFEIDWQNHCVREREQLLVNASATLKYEEYAELFGMKPSSTASPVVLLSGKRKEATCVI